MPEEETNATPDRSAKPSRLASLVLAAGATLVALLLAEVGLRLFRPVAYRAPARPLSDEAWEQLLHRPSRIPGLAYELAPDREVVHRGIAVRTNRYGMRDRDPTPPAADPATAPFRIAVLGDSVTFGYGVAQEEAWPKVLERQLAASSRSGEPRYETLNFGVAGYATHDEALVLEHRALAWQPRLVLVGFSFNDAETQPLQPLQQAFLGVAWWQHFHLLRLFAQWRHERAIARYGSYIRALYAPGGEGFPSVVAGFERFARLTRPRGIPVLVVIFPQFKRMGSGPYPDTDLHERVAAAARGAGLHVVDLLPGLAKLPASALRLPRDPMHPSPRGHRAAARIVHDDLRAEPSLLAAPPAAARGPAPPDAEASPRPR